LLVLVFHVGGDRYALPCRDIVEVVPQIGLRAIPQAPRFVSGLMVYRGEVTPVIDLGELFAGRKVDSRMSTRTIVVRGPTARNLGLLAEQVTDAINVEPGEITASPIRIGGAEYLGGVIREGDRQIQLIEVEHLLPPEVLQLLARESREPG
jgi:chemotaxis-related protein WspB